MNGSVQILRVIAKRTVFRAGDEQAGVRWRRRLTSLDAGEKKRGYISETPNWPPTMYTKSARGCAMIYYAMHDDGGPSARKMRVRTR